MTVSFERQTRIDAPVERVFDLSLSVEVHLASMAASREEVTDGVKAGVMGLDDVVTWRATHFGMPFTMTSKVVELDRPTCFVDEQVSGPFRRYRHEHRFEPAGDDAESTVMVDRVEVEAPAWIFGRIAEHTWLGRYVAHVIDERNRYLKTEAEAAR